MISALHESGGRFISQAVFEFGPHYTLRVVRRTTIEEYEISVFHNSIPTELIGVTLKNGSKYNLTINDVNCIILKLINLTGYYPQQV
jgi:hypothetical protein